jgi:ribonuclease T1
MTRSFPGRLLLTLALIVLVLGVSGCARVATPPPTASAATVAPATAAAPIAAVTGATPTPAAAAATSQARPTATPSRSPIPGGLAIATPPPGDRMPTVKIDRLPPEALDTIRLIARNGPFPYRQDGVVFENRERLLPAKATGYYREYTVKTPGSPDRGARRLIRGGQNELYYTDDHYGSFRRVTP